MTVSRCIAARLRQQHSQHDPRRSRLEQRARDPLHRLRRGALAHPDHDRAVSDRLHVATLDVGTPPVLVVAAPPGRCTITFRSLPTSECTPNDMAITSLRGGQSWCR
jgi:hypothetical protein